VHSQHLSGVENSLTNEMLIFHYMCNVTVPEVGNDSTPEFNHSS
jgi:hypothetical protein